MSDQDVTYDSEVVGGVKCDANPLGLSTNQLEKLGADITREVDYSDMSITDLKARWERLVKLFELDGSVTNLNLVPGISTYPYPLSRQKLDEIRAQVYKSITGFEPYVQMVPFNKAEAEMAAAARVQAALQIVATQDPGPLGFDRALRLCLKLVVNAGVTIMQVWVDEEEGMLRCDAVAAQDFCFYPHEFRHMARAKTIGKKFFQARAEVRSKQKKDFYLHCDIGGADYYDSYAGSSPRERGTSETPPAVPDDDKMKFYQVVRKCHFAEPGSKEDEQSNTSDSGDWHVGDMLIVVHYDTKQVVRVEPFRYKTGRMFFDLRLEEEYGTFWAGNSPGNLLQGLQLAISDLLNTLVQGSYGSAFGEKHITGESAPTKITRQGPGTTHYHPNSEVKIWNTPTTFNPQPVVMSIGALNQTADQISKITPVGTTEALKSDTSATEAAAFFRNKDAGKDEYTTYILPSIAEIFEYIKELMTVHWRVLTKKQGNNFGLRNHNDLKLKGRIVPTGKLSNPGSNLQKAEAAYKLASNPESGYDIGKVADLVMTLLELPVDPDTLKKLGPSAHELTMILQGLLMWAQWKSAQIEAVGQEAGIDPAALAAEEPPEGAVSPEEAQQIIMEIQQRVAKLPSDQGLDASGNAIVADDEAPAPAEGGPPLALIGNTVAQEA